MNRTDTHFIGGSWIAGSGDEFASTNPASGEVNWRGHAATADDVSAATAAAREAFPAWAAKSLAERAALLQAVAERYRADKQSLAEIISRETGKPRWESLTEVDAMIAKIPISIEAHNDRCRELWKDISGVISSTRFKPHGVLAVLGPFNMPGHLPNGHIIPALLAGNAIVFKSSEQTPLVGEKMIAAFADAGFPRGVVNLVQGGAETGGALARDGNTNGLLFTGSTNAGIALRRMLADYPEKILALEMGGNNPLIFHDASDLGAAVYTILQSAFVTSGQRCSCARRLIVCKSEQANALLEKLSRAVTNLRVGFWNDEPAPFVGTVISARAAADILAAQAQRLTTGGAALVEMRTSPRSAALLSPGLIDVTKSPDRPDVEIFGPLLQVIRVDDCDAAMAEANRTAFGLSAGLISESAEIYAEFARRIRAGVLSWNRPTTGASSQLPFGGIGRSGNHRPGAYFAADYSAYPVASVASAKVQLPAQLPPGISL
ncbi:MAG: succinylglutamate-semialdehyde dehydrogenase [Planctomycetota bacterium]|nr:succinylglutamate-semialdehyde dehydrogenase [Planctomycetota bacterium]